MASISDSPDDAADSRPPTSPRAPRWFNTRAICVILASVRCSTVGPAPAGPATAPLPAEPPRTMAGEQISRFLGAPARRRRPSLERVLAQLGRDADQRQFGMRRGWAPLSLALATMGGGHPAKKGE
eukprot:scaffold21214_cov101-Isochrysis_galbana.AAC.1